MPVSKKRKVETVKIVIKKNDNIKKSVSKIEKAVEESSRVEVVGIGEGIQKMISIVEIAKGVLQKKGVVLRQYNKLDWFEKEKSVAGVLAEADVGITEQPKKEKTVVLNTLLSSEDVSDEYAGWVEQK